MEIVIRKITHAELEDVYRLTYREYVRAGYAEPDDRQALAHYPHLDGIPETTVFGAFVDDELVGTNSLTVDGPEGLHVDHDFGDQVNRIRRWCRSRGLNLGASWRIVTDRRVRHNLRTMLNLVRATVVLGCEKALHVTLYSFNPHHERVYRKFLGLETIARDVCRAVGEAPAVLMMGDSRVITSRCPKLGLDCYDHCHPPLWPALAGRWTGEIR